jgi:hypothetical protein
MRSFATADEAAQLDDLRFRTSGGIAMNGYGLEGWSDLFLASAGAAAALSGLIFVGLSVNIRTVLDLDRGTGDNFLTGRAIEALVALLNVLVISLVALTPTIDRGVLVGFILLSALISAISPTRASIAARRLGQLTAGTAWRIVLASGVTLTLVAAGVTLADKHGGGLDWLPATFVLSIAVAAINAWVLLVEVLR